MSPRLASLAASLLTAVGLLTFGQSAWAGRTQLADFAADCPTTALCADPMTMQVSNYEMDGQYWHGPNQTPSPGSPIRTTLNIPLNFGGVDGAVTGRHILFDGINGTLVFTDAAGTPTGDFISPLGVPPLGYSPNYVNGFMTFGELDPLLLHGGSTTGYTYDPTNTLKAYRFNWPATCPLANADGFGDCFGDTFENFQAVIIAITDDDFMVQFNYQNFHDAPAGAVGTFQLGANSNVLNPYTGPFLQIGPDFCFHDGNQVSCSDLLGVPEPAPLTLIPVGIALLGYSAWRRRVNVAVVRTHAA